MDITQLSQKIQDLEERVKRLESSNPPSQGLSQVQSKPKEISPKEFLLSKKLSSAVEKTLALAYYIEYVSKVGSFNVDDLSEIFQLAKEKSPANLNDMINKNVVKGHLMEAREKKNLKKAWVLTATGEKFIEGKTN